MYYSCLKNYHKTVQIRRLIHLFFTVIKSLYFPKHKNTIQFFFSLIYKSPAQLSVKYCTVIFRAAKTRHIFMQSGTITTSKFPLFWNKMTVIFDIYRKPLAWILAYCRTCFTCIYYIGFIFTIFTLQFICLFCI